MSEPIAFACVYIPSEYTEGPVVKLYKSEELAVKSFVRTVVIQQILNDDLVSFKIQEPIRHAIVKYIQAENYNEALGAWRSYMRNQVFPDAVHFVPVDDISDESE